MDAKVTMAISDMVSGITMAHDGIERTVTSGAIRDRNLSELIAARDYILAAESQIAERDAQIADTELMLRKEWWVNHRCPISALYGDDGEMQCNASCCMKDFKRAPIGELRDHVQQRRMAWLNSDEAKRIAAELGLEANS